MFRNLNLFFSVADAFDFGQEEDFDSIVPTQPPIYVSPVTVWSQDTGPRRSAFDGKSFGSGTRMPRVESGPSLSQIGGE